MGCRNPLPELLPLTWEEQVSLPPGFFSTETLSRGAAAPATQY